MQNVLLLAGLAAGYKLLSYAVANRATLATLLKAYLTKLEAKNKVTTPSSDNPLLGGGYKAPPTVAVPTVASGLLKSPLLLVAVTVGGTLLATKVDFKQVTAKLSSLIAVGGVSRSVVAEPTTEYKQLVAPLAPVVTGKPGAKDLAEFYVALADVLTRDTGNNIETSGQFTSWVDASALLAYGNSTYAGQFPGLLAAMTTIVKDTLKDANNAGDDDIAMTPEKKARVIAMLRACAWTCQQ
jgi:hypothetical protein